MDIKDEYKVVGNHNAMANCRYKLEIPNLEIVNYFIQRTALPSVSVPTIDTPHMNHIGKIAGETPIYEELNFDFVVDEMGYNHQCLLEWMISFQKQNNPIERYMDVTLHVLDRNSKSMAEYVFYGAHITNLGQISFDSTTSDTEEVFCNAVMSYQYYERVRT